MRNLILSALLLASAFQTALGQTDWDWDYYNQGIVISRYRGSGGAVTIPSSINGTPVVMLTNYGGEATLCSLVSAILLPLSQSPTA